MPKRATKQESELRVAHAAELLEAKQWQPTKDMFNY